MIWNIGGLSFGIWGAETMELETLKFWTWEAYGLECERGQFLNLGGLVVVNLGGSNLGAALVFECGKHKVWDLASLILGFSEAYALESGRPKCWKPGRLCF